MERNEEQENEQSQRTHQKLESRSKIENVPDNDTVYDSIFSAGGAYFNISDPVECVILSILVDTFISKISFPMQPGPEIGSISDA